MGKKMRCPRCGRYQARRAGIIRRKWKCKYCSARFKIRYKEVKEGFIRKQTVEVVPLYKIKGGTKKLYKNRKLREKALKKAKSKCQNCGSKCDLQVHHKKPISEGGKDKLSNLKVLCYDCHLQVHGKKRRPLSWS